VLGTYTLLEAARQAWEKYPEPSQCRFIHISTDEVYGSLSADDTPCTEDTPYAPSSPYSASKAASDWLARSYLRTYIFPVIITNCSNNYGPYQFPEKLIPFALCQALESKPIPIYGTGSNVRDWLYVEDHCRAVLQVLGHGRVGETYNIAGQQEKTNLELVHLLLKQLHSLRPDLKSLEKLITFVPDRPGHDWRYALNTKKIREALGWQPQVSLEQGLRETVSWYLSQPDWLNRVRSGEYRHYLRQQYGNVTG
jgi:dTDP-glucose 4,6-dehydratase